MRNLFIMAALAVTSTAFAAEVNVGKAVLGSGSPVYNASGTENAVVVDNAKVENNILHTPQYMPYHPTAGTIYPRVVEVPCKVVNGNTVCESYNWTPSMGRAEYLYIKPKMVEAPKADIMMIKEVIVPGPVVEKIVEVERKKKKE